MSTVWLLILGIPSHTFALTYSCNGSVKVDEELNNSVWRQLSIRYSLFESVSDHIKFSLIVIFCIPGIVGSVLMILVMIKSRKCQCKLTIRRFMEAIAAADLFYCACSIAMHSLLFLHGIESPTRARLYVIIAAYVTECIASCFSDLVTTLLAFQRCIALFAPLFWRSRSDQWKERFCGAGIVFCFVLSMFRCHAFSNFKVQATDRYGVTESSYINISTITMMNGKMDTFNLFTFLILPLILIFLILLFHTSVIWKMKHRHRNSVSPTGQWPTCSIKDVNLTGRPIASNTALGSLQSNDLGRETKEKDSKNMRLLVASQSTSAVFCQVSYIAQSSITLAGFNVANVELCNSKAAGLWKIGLVIFPITFATECLARSSLFYINLMFNKHFRYEVVQSLFSLTQVVACKPSSLAV
ncbi:unnamed protein product [Soboliphyme baturini]|uniref:G_PROTEIN_RECEP_F1_2 domain-containing protein n=1 Tax=Soboliphyme baturini TaxID=241478 RepID=A0A183J6B1_9BILA|nr:unnamed protein product [Soboliphyme baturini]